MNWYIGQDIVAIKNHSQHKFNEGDLFTIKGLRDSLCKCGHVLIDIGFKSSSIPSNSVCVTCKIKSENISGIWWFSETNFRPLDELADISELTEILETTKPYEV